VAKPWMALHSGLEVTERQKHSVDAFPRGKGLTRWHRSRPVASQPRGGAASGRPRRSSARMSSPHFRSPVRAKP